MKFITTYRFAEYLWYVLDVDEQENKALLLSVKLLKSLPYHRNENVGYWLEQRIQETTWENCSLRRYLNGEFYNSLGEDAKGQVVETTLQNPSNPWFGTDGGNDTTDKVFVLSLEEVMRYMGDGSEQLQNRHATEWMIDDSDNSFRIARLIGDAKDTAMSWWLRSSGATSICATNVRADGGILVNGQLINRKSMGVRPALWVDLSKETNLQKNIKIVA